MGHVKQDSMPVIRELSAFDRHSGNLLERLVFNHRALFMLVMTLATLVLGAALPTPPNLDPLSLAGMLAAWLGQLLDAEAAQPLGAGALEELEVVGVEHDAAGVGVFPVHAHRPVEMLPPRSAALRVAAPRGG